LLNKFNLTFPIGVNIVLIATVIFYPIYAMIITRNIGIIIDVLPLHYSAVAIDGLLFGIFAVLIFPRFKEYTVLATIAVYGMSEGIDWAVADPLFHRPYLFPYYPLLVGLFAFLLARKIHFTSKHYKVSIFFLGVLLLWTFLITVVVYSTLWIIHPVGYLILIMIIYPLLQLDLSSGRT
jgi:hypothetical protein